MDYQRHFESLMRLIMPQSFPIGIKIVKKDDPFPGRVHRPSRYGIQVALCQWTTLARRWGWVVGAMAEDINCTPCLAGLGFRKLQDQADLIQYLIEMGYCATPDLASSLVEQVESLEPGKIKGIAAFPLDRAPLSPDLVVIYGMPAQMIRLTIGYIHNHGRLIRSETGIGLSCLSTLMPFWKQEPSLIHPGRGERTFAGTDDSEMCFSIPASQLESLMDGLEQTQKKRMRYPIQGYLLYQPRLASPMEALREKLVEP
jgi:uncharacterized protein (DUF169 family)